VRLPEHLIRLTHNGAVLCKKTYEAGYVGRSAVGVVDYVAFDLASTYPCSDGLIYTLSPDTPPDSGYLLSEPTALAPHWWVAIWDPAVGWHDWGGSRGSDKAETFDADGEGFAEMDTDPSLVDVPLETIAGRMQTWVNFADTGSLMLYLDIGESKPRAVYLNRYTVCHWPENWVPQTTIPDEGLDLYGPWVEVPLHPGESLGGREVTATVKTIKLAGSDRTQSFAVEITIGDL
jgi:hypothetical protein